MQNKKNDRYKTHHKKTIFYKKYLNLLSLLFIAVIVLLPLVSLLIPDTKFSPAENRILSAFPRFSFDSLIDGRYTKKVEKYVADQFINRNSWIHTKTNTDRLLGRNYSNGIFLGKDHYLIKNFTPLPQETINHSTEAINNFYDKHPNLNHYFMLVPTAITIYSNRLPNHAPVLNQTEFINQFNASLYDNIKILNPTSILNAKKDDALYYKTDHHWTTHGAWLAFQDVSPIMDITPAPDSYSVYPVTQDFSGALVSKSGYALADTDIIEIYIPKNDDDYSVVTYQDKQEKSPSLYYSGNLTEKDKYAVFLDGNHPLLTIENPVNNHRNLLIIKDSYANAFIPFLTPYFSEITVIDPRYYYDSIDQLINDSDITDILYLYNANTFFKDTNLEPVLNDN
jgi:hypothetical protein